jgi:hypothetical protein
MDLNQSICWERFNDRPGVIVSRELREALPVSNAPTPTQGRSGTTHVGDDMTGRNEVSVPVGAYGMYLDPHGGIGCRKTGGWIVQSER